MKRSIIYSIFLVMTLGITSCMEEYCNYDRKPRPGEKPPVLFQYEYYNYAWGFRHHGFLIDEYGHVKGFDQPKEWTAPDSLGMITEAGLLNNLAQCDTVCTTVEREDLDYYFRKIEDVRDGKIADYGLLMADAGTGTFSAWSWNEKSGKYENIFLISNGDLNRVNTNQDVNPMVEWLKTIGKSTNRFWWFDGK